MATPDLTRTRFSRSPLWETVASLRVLGGRFASVHAPWLACTRERAKSVELSRLLALVPPNGHVADFLTPAPTTRRPSFTAELHSVATATAAAVTRDLDHLLGSQPTPAAERTLRQARTAPAEFAATVAEDLRGYWEACLAPHWQRLLSLDEADISWRLAESAIGGPHRVLNQLHPHVRAKEGILQVRTACVPDEVADPTHGLVLIPCAFAWPDVLFLNTVDSVPALGYAPRGVASLWHRPSRDTGDAPLPALIGRSRAAILELLDIPMTTHQLAAHLGCASPTVSAHLKVLRRAGAVANHRNGKEVFYGRTDLGRQLLQLDSAPGGGAR